MKKKYTRKQILESIKYWKDQIKKGNYKKLNESYNDINYYRVECDIDNDDESDRLSNANPLQIMYNYPDPGNTYTGVVAASSKKSLEKILNLLIDDGLKRDKCSKPMVTNESPYSLDDCLSIENTNGNMDASFIINNALKGKYVTYLVYENDDPEFANEPRIIVFSQKDPNDGDLCFIEELFCENK